MEQEAKERSAIVLRSKQSNSETSNGSAERLNRIAEMVTATAEVMGTELSAPALNLFVEDLSQLSDEAIVRGLTRCRRELRGKNGFPAVLTIADVMEKAGVMTQAEIEEAECRAAWDEMQRYVARYVVRDPHGTYVERDFIGNTGRVSKPPLSQRIRDTVRRIGGWCAVVNPAEDDFPHVQRRFYEEYRAWDATAYATQKLLAETPGLDRLAAKVTMPALGRRCDIGSQEQAGKPRSV